MYNSQGNQKYRETLLTLIYDGQLPNSAHLITNIWLDSKSGVFSAILNFNLIFELNYYSLKSVSQPFWLVTPLQNSSVWLGPLSQFRCL